MPTDRRRPRCCVVAADGFREMEPSMRPKDGNLLVSGFRGLVYTGIYRYGMYYSVYTKVSGKLWEGGGGEGTQVAEKKLFKGARLV